eukprot:108808-Rhodomonas_salina.1
MSGTKTVMSGTDIAMSGTDIAMPSTDTAHVASRAPAPRADGKRSSPSPAREVLIASRLRAMS